MDRLSRQVLDGLRPLSFEIVDRPDDLDAVLRMRYECVVDMGWARPEEFPDGCERDACDPAATFVVCRDGGAIAGTIRVVPPAADGLLPIERDLGVRVDPPGDAVEAGRLVVASRYRGRAGHPILAGLFSRCWLVTRELGYDRLISLIPAKLVDLYRTLGLRIDVLAPPRMHWGQERIPVEVSGGDDTFIVLRRGERHSV